MFIDVDLSDTDDLKTPNLNHENSSHRLESSSPQTESRLPNVIIATYLSLAVHQVQIQALEVC